MNKWQIICPLVAMAIAALVFGIIFGRNQRQSFISVASRSIGRDLIVSTNSKNLVRVEPDLTAKLGTLLSSKTSLSAVILGDAPAPTGDGRACSRIVLTNEAGRGLAIRLRPTDGPGMFQVLGFHSISPEDFRAD